MMNFYFKGRPLTEKESSLFIKLYMSGIKELPLEEEKILEKEFLSKVLIKRITALKLPFKISSGFFLLSIYTVFNNPGKIIMLLWIAYNYFKKTKKTFLGISEWADIFPFGVPTETELEQMWDSQKAPGAPMGNLLDDCKTWYPDPAPGFFR